MLFLINSIPHHLLPFSIHFYPFTLFIACLYVCPSCTATFICFLCFYPFLLPGLLLGLSLILYLFCYGSPYTGLPVTLCLACFSFSTCLAMVCPYTGLPLTLYLACF